MANNNPKTCEEYVLNQFFKTEVELATTQKELQETKTQLENANELVEICKELSKYIIIKKEEFIDFDGDVHIKLPTIQQMMNADKDKAFQRADGWCESVGKTFRTGLRVLHQKCIYMSRMQRFTTVKRF